MTLQPKLFEELKPYLIYDRKLSANKHNMQIYQSRFNIMCRYFGERKFDRANFNSFIGFLREKGYSNNYINNFIKLAKHVDRFYKINELQDYTYFDKPVLNVDTLTPEEIEKMIEVTIPYRTDAERKNQRNKVLLSTLFLTGARVNEVLNLSWDDLKEGTVPYLIINQTKVKEIRYAPIPQTLYHSIVNLPHFGGFIFSNDLGYPLDPETVSSDIKRRARAIGISRRVYSHLFRHTFINLMLRNGAKIQEVSRLVGHKSIETTNQHYVHIQLQELNDVLHTYHPALKKHQTLETITRRVRELCANILDTDKFALQVAKKDNQVSFHVKEVEE